MGDPVALDAESTGTTRILRSVSPPVRVDEPDHARLADDLAAALRAIRGYVPHHIWWGAGPARALLAYQAVKVT